MAVRQEELDIAHGIVFLKSDPGKSLPVGAVAEASGSGAGGIEVIGEETSRRTNPKTGRNMWEKSLAALCCEVEVDTETGKIDVLKMVLACDCGVAINPEVVTGQCDGGMIQGLGFAVYEDMVFDENHEGVILNPTMVDYKIPTFPELADFTAIVHCDPADAPTPPLHAKGMGEATIIPVAPAIANAVYNAIGIRVRSGPLTPDRILRALRNEGAER